MLQHHPAHSHFPVLRSKLRVDALASALESEYGLAGVRCQLIKGTVRDTYKVTSRDGPYVFSIYGHGHRTPGEVGAELDLLDHLAAGGLRVAPAVPLLDGAPLLELDAPEGARYGVLFAYVPGRHLDRRPDPAAARAYGRAVARMHAEADALPGTLDRPRIDFERMVERPIEAFASVETARSEGVAYLREAAAALRPRIAALPAGQPYYGLVHGDVIPSNAQVTPEGEIALLDFDFCGYGWRVYDLATYRGEVRFWDAPPAAADAFLAGYEEVRPLESWERAAIPLFEAARHIHSLGTPALMVNEWGSAYLSDRMVDTLLTCVRASLAELDRSELT